MTLEDRGNPTTPEQCYAHFSEKGIPLGYYIDADQTEFNVNVCPFAAVINLKTGVVTGMDTSVYLEVEDILELVIEANQ